MKRAGGNWSFHSIRKSSDVCMIFSKMATHLLLITRAIMWCDGINCDRMVCWYEATVSVLLAATSTMATTTLSTTAVPTSAKNLPFVRVKKCLSPLSPSSLLSPVAISTLHWQFGSKKKKKKNHSRFLNLCLVKQHTLIPFTIMPIYRPHLYSPK